MYYERKMFQDILEVMASCEALGLDYIVEKENVVIRKWLGTPIHETVYRLRIVQFREVGENVENEEILLGGLGES